MATISLKQLDQLIENALTNITPVNQQSIATNRQPDNKELEKIGKPMTDFLDNVENEENDSIDYNSKLKSIITDPHQKKSRDIEIANSKKKIQAVKKIHDDFTNNQNAILKQQQEKQMQLQQDLEAIKAQKDNFEQMLRQQIRESFEDQMPDINKFDSLPIMKRSFPHIGESTAQVPAPNTTQIAQPGLPAPPAKKKIVRVNFDSKTEHPFQVEFSERGFLIGSTRLSFEIIEHALSKNFNITLDGGSGMALDAIKMQKILRYKDLF